MSREISLSRHFYESSPNKAKKSKTLGSLHFDNENVPSDFSSSPVLDEDGLASPLEGLRLSFGDVRHLYFDRRQGTLICCHCLQIIRSYFPVILTILLSTISIGRSKIGQLAIIGIILVRTDILSSLNHEIHKM